MPQNIPGMADVAVDLHVLGFSAGLALLTGMLFAMAPALSAVQIDLADSIKTGHLWPGLLFGLAKDL